MKYRYERIDEKTGRIADRLTVGSAEKLIRCIKMLEGFSKHKAKSDKGSRTKRVKKRSVN